MDRMTMSTRDRSHLETEDRISDDSMRKMQRIVDACVERGARLSIVRDEVLGAWVVRLSAGSGSDMFTVMACETSRRLAIWALAFALMSKHYPRFLTREQIEAAIEGR